MQSDEGAFYFLQWMDILQKKSQFNFKLSQGNQYFK